MSKGEPLEEFTIKSYRYLRLSIVVVVVALLASVVIERTKVDCWQGSLSAYYYTPVHAIFVGALVTIGVCLIAVRGRPTWEDMLLNVAGVLAPIVAFVPTKRPSPMCTSSPFGVVDAEAYIDNNVLAFAIGGVVAIAVAVGIATIQQKVELGPPDKWTAVGLALGAALAVAGLVWYFGFRASFLANAHNGTAITMFVIVGIVIAINAFRAHPNYRPVYAALAVFMALAGLGVLLAWKLIWEDWPHAVLWLELVELVPFAIFWAAQTLEHWEGGLPPGALKDPGVGSPARS